MMTANEIKGEEWRPLPNAGGIYEVSSHGRVRSCARNPNKWRMLSVYPSGRPGHERPTCAVFRKNRYVHQLMAEAFLGPRPNGMEVAHIDGDGWNNTVENIMWATHKENMHQAMAHGTVPVLTEGRGPQANLSREKP